MSDSTRLRTAFTLAAGALGVGAGAYVAYAGLTWFRYGRPTPADAEDADRLLDEVMPVYDVVERHHIHVAAPAEVTLAAACEMDLQQSAIVRAIFRAREVILGSKPDTPPIRADCSH